MVINMMEAKYLMPFFFLGFIVAAFTGINLVGFGIMGAVLAILYVQLNPKYHQQPSRLDEIEEL
ncbi:Mannose permease IIC component [compost metagenome]